MNALARRLYGIALLIFLFTLSPLASPLTITASSGNPPSAPIEPPLEAPLSSVSAQASNAVGSALWDFTLATGGQYGSSAGLDVVDVPRFNQSYTVSEGTFRPCAAQARGTCHFDTRAFLTLNNGVIMESITAYGRYWNFNATTGALISTGTLSGVSRYASGPCAGQSGACRFESLSIYTQPGGTRIETIVAQGRMYNYNADTGAVFDVGLSPTLGFTLNRVSRYASGPCVGTTGAGCVFDSRAVYTTRSGQVVETITAYGKIWLFDGENATGLNATQASLSAAQAGMVAQASSGGNLTAIPYFANGPCAGTTGTGCTFHTREVWSLDGGATLIDSVMARSPAAPNPTVTPTNTPVAPTATRTRTSTPVPPTATATRTNTPVPPTSTPVPPTATATRTNTPVPPTSTPVPPTATATRTNTPVPPTSTPVPPTATLVPTTTPVPPTATPTRTNTPVPATATATRTSTPVPATATSTQTATSSPTTQPPPTSTPYAGGTLVRINAGGAVQTVNGTTWQACSGTSNCSGYVSGSFAYTISATPTITSVPAGMNEVIFRSEWAGTAAVGRRPLRSTSPSPAGAISCGSTLPS